MIATIFIAITAFVYSHILTQPGEIFGKLYARLDVFFNTDKRSCEGLGFHPVFKMIMACPKCVSGQLSFWFYLAHYYSAYLSGTHSFVYNAFTHIGFTCTTIFITVIIKTLHEKYIN